MRTVEIHLPPNALVSQMAAMRVWLDERRFEPSSFNCYESQAGVAVRLHFKVGREAEAFAERFGGHLDQPATDEQWVNDALARSSLSPAGVIG
jgi:hypothetical protein